MWQINSSKPRLIPISNNWLKLLFTTEIILQFANAHFLHVAPWTWITSNTSTEVGTKLLQKPFCILLISHTQQWYQRCSASTDIASLQVFNQHKTFCTKSMETRILITLLETKECYTLIFHLIKQQSITVH